MTVSGLPPGVLRTVLTWIYTKICGPIVEPPPIPQQFRCAGCGYPRADVMLKTLEEPVACLKECGWQMVATMAPDSWAAIGAEVHTSADQWLGGIVVWFRPK